ncbi:hypothetical protein [Helicobacter sp. 23-1045]
MHYCNLESDFLHHEAGEILVLRTDLILLWIASPCYRKDSQ